MKMLVLDFDGVISDSAPEAFEVALRTYFDLMPASTLQNADKRTLYRQFLELMPLGNRAEDYGVMLAVMERDAMVGDQESYNSFLSKQDQAWLSRYHVGFYETRTALKQKDMERWLGLMRPYGSFAETLHRHAGKCSYAIATAKDRGSVDLLLDSYGLSGLFPAELIMDKETGRSKSAHVGKLAQRSGIALPDISFIDDKVNHLDSVAELEVRCVLAEWGYNGEREHMLARSRGYLVCSLEDVEERLFAG